MAGELPRAWGRSVGADDPEIGARIAEVYRKERLRSHLQTFERNPDAVPKELTLEDVRRAFEREINREEGGGDA